MIDRKAPPLLFTAWLLAGWSHDAEVMTPDGLPSTNPDGTEAVIFRSTAPFGTSQREFLRVKAQSAP